MTNICVSLETAKKLKEAWREKETCFSYWDDRKPHKSYNCPPVHQYVDSKFVPFRNLSDKDLGNSRWQWMMWWWDAVFWLTDFVKGNIYDKSNKDVVIPAPTTQEILDEFEKVKERISIRWNYPNWRAYILERDYLHDFAQGRWDKLVEALADLWLACKEQWYLDTLPQ